MIIHPFMAEAIYLRMYPNDRLLKPDGKMFWYCENTNKYWWTNPKVRNKVYEARGLMSWWNAYLKQIEEEKNNFEEEEGFPY